MGLLEKLKSFLGTGQQSSGPRGGEPDVTVEREPSAESEHAVKGTDGTDERIAGETSTETGSATPSDVDASTGTVEPDADDAESAVAEAASDEAASEAPADASTGADDAAAESPPVDEIKGIGPTYADRLGDAGIETVADLAAADAATVADAAETSESRAADWIERASE